MTKRKYPKATTLRELYVLSGNLCARPACDIVLVNANGTSVASVCHIKAESPGGPRYDKQLSKDERRSAPNLLLLCNTCHKLVDSEPSKYTVKVLRKWKHDREQRFREIGDTLRQRYMETITDEAELVPLTTPTSLAGYAAFLDAQNCMHCIDRATVSAVAEYVDRLRHLSLPDRDLLAAIIEKSLALPDLLTYDGDIQVHPDDLRTLLVKGKRLSKSRILQLSDTLSRNRLGGLDGDEPPCFFINTPADSLGWSDLAEFLTEKGYGLRSLICDLKFGLLD